MNHNNKLSKSYLFRTHPEAVIRRWVNALSFGYYKRAWGGHANDGDEFGIWLDYGSRKQLLQIMQVLGIALKTIQSTRNSATKTELSKSTLKDYPEFEQPLHIKINTLPCFVWIENGKIKITFSGAKDGNRYEVSETDFENCLKLEQLIAEKQLQKYVSNAFEKLPTHITKTTYPELFD